jgi:hypothetical protein
MYGVRKEGERDFYLCWIGTGVVGVGTTISSNWPEPWDLAQAKTFIDEHRSPDYPVAVYLVRGRGRVGKKIYPRKEE